VDAELERLKNELGQPSAPRELEGAPGQNQVVTGGQPMQADQPQAGEGQ